MHKPSTRPPEKWLKYELLDLYGLAKIEFFRKSIRQFSRAEYASALTHLTKEIRTALREKKHSGRDAFFVTKLVRRELSILLPNVRIKTLEDIDLLQRAIQGRPETQDELCFAERISVQKFSAAVAESLLIFGVSPLRKSSNRCGVVVRD